MFVAAMDTKVSEPSDVAQSTSRQDAPQQNHQSTSVRSHHSHAVYIEMWMCTFLSSTNYLYTVFRKKHPLTFSFISPCVISRFKQKLQ